MECDDEPGRGSEGAPLADAAHRPATHQEEDGRPPTARWNQGAHESLARLPLRDSSNHRAGAAAAVAAVGQSQSQPQSQCVWESQSPAPPPPVRRPSHESGSDVENSDPDCVVLAAPPPSRKRLLNGPPRRLVDPPARAADATAALASNAHSMQPVLRAHSMPAHQSDASLVAAAAVPVVRSASSSSSFPSSDFAAAPGGGSAAKGSAAAFNALVRSAKSLEGRESWAEALCCYEEMQTMRPQLESVAKKVRILTKRIATQRQAEKEQEEADQTITPVSVQPAAGSVVPVARMLPLFLDGKFAYDETQDVYWVVLPPADACTCAAAAAAASGSGVASELDEDALTLHHSSCLSSGHISSTSPLLSLRPFRVPGPMYSHTFPHQREAIHWLYTHLHLRRTGGILGDDMGLGKTIQVCTYVAALFFNRLVRRVLIIVPMSVVSHWQRELRKWCGARCEVDPSGGDAADAEAPAAGCAYSSGLALRLVTIYAGSRTHKQRQLAERAVCSLMNDSSSGGVVLATYGQFQSSQPDLFSRFADARRQWDYAILDEGHKMKNPDTQLAGHLRALPVRHRLLLTGTPVMNNLEELWALMDWATERTILGTRRNFKADFAARIMGGLAKGASHAEQELGARLTAQLQDIIRPHLLRREKGQVEWGNKHKDQPRQHDQHESGSGRGVDGRAGYGGDDDHAGQDEDPSSSRAARIPRSLSVAAGPSSSSSSSPSLPQLTAQKNDWIVWLHLTPLQDKLYRLFLGDSSVRSVFSAGRSRGPLPVLSALKKLCDHPRMIDQSMEYMDALRDDLRALPPLPGVHLPYAAAAADSSSASKNKDAFAALASLAAAQTPESRAHLDASVSLLCSESYKFACLRSLLASHVAAGHRTLIFSQSRRMLAFVALLLASMRILSLRIDGGVSDPLERQRRVDTFNSDPRYQAFLLTTRAGGVGICLTGADRVVVLDPDWAPSLDNQAVDRCYRLGQKRNVVVYRFITCGTVEEVVYRKQVFKGSVIRAATGGQEPHKQPQQQQQPQLHAPNPAHTTTRYFNKEELREVFHYTSSETSSAFDSLRALHPPSQRNTYPELETHAAEVESIVGVHGITDHDLMFQQTATQTTDQQTAEEQSQQQPVDAADGSADSQLLDPGIQAALAADAAEEQRAKLESLVAQATARAQSGSGGGGGGDRSPLRAPKPKQRTARTQPVDTIDIPSSSSDDDDHDDDDDDSEEDAGYASERQQRQPPTGFGPPPSASTAGAMSSSSSSCDSDAHEGSESESESDDAHAYGADGDGRRLGGASPVSAPALAPAPTRQFIDLVDSSDEEQDDANDCSRMEQDEDSGLSYATPVFEHAPVAASVAAALVSDGAAPSPTTLPAPVASIPSPAPAADPVALLLSPPPAVVLQLSESDSDAAIDSDSDPDSDSVSDEDCDEAHASAASAAEDESEGDASFADAREWRDEGVEDRGLAAVSPDSPPPLASVHPAPPHLHAPPSASQLLSAHQIHAYNAHLSQGAQLQREYSSRSGATDSIDAADSLRQLQQLEHLLHAASLCDADPLLRQRIMRIVAQTGLEACLADGEQGDGI